MLPGIRSLNCPLYSPPAPPSSREAPERDSKELQDSLRDPRALALVPSRHGFPLAAAFPASMFGRGSLLLTHPSPQRGGAFPSGAVLESGTHGSLMPLDLFVSRQVSLHPTKDGRLFPGVVSEAPSRQTSS